MRKIGISGLSVVILLFFASAMQAQNQSAENSDVILYNGWYEFVDFVYCPSTGPIYFSGSVHELFKTLDNGTFVGHYNAYGEGTDDFGGEWKWHDAWNWKEIYTPSVDITETRNLTLQGPKGAKLQIKALFVIRDGELINSHFDPLCE